LIRCNATKSAIARQSAGDPIVVPSSEICRQKIFRSASAGALLRRMLSFPPFWAVIVALVLNVLHVPVPALLLDTLGWVGRLILLLVILALGILFDVRLLRSGRVAGILLLRIGLGLALAWGFVTVTGLTGLPRAVVLLAGMAPIGFSVVAMANREKLDSELAASAASLTVLMALVYVPVMLWMLHLPG
jgi:predicted permease